MEWPLEDAPKRLLSTYFDTADGRLQAGGLALRVREKQGRYIQTAKGTADGRTGLLARIEYEAELPDGDPDLTRLPTGLVAGRAGLMFNDDLAPVFATDINRRTAEIEPWPGHRLELALDEGRITAGDQGQTVSELEVELKSGHESAMFTVAAQIARAVPVSIQHASKSERGYRLSHRRPPDWRRAVEAHIARDADCGAAFDAISRSCFSHWMGNGAAAADGEDPEGVHQLRVSLRRLRAALSLFRPVLGAEVAGHWSAELKWLAGEVAPARDIDVFIGELLPPSLPDADDGARRVLEDAALVMKDGAYRQVRRTLACRRYARLVTGFGAWLSAGDWRLPDNADALARPALHFAAERLERRRRKILKSGRGFASLADDARHEVRIELKKLRYAADFFSAVEGQKKAGSYRRHLRLLQDGLGRLNDLAAAQAITEQLLARSGQGPDGQAVARAVGLVVGWWRREAQSANRQMIAGWREFKSTSGFWRRW